jgi:hypothetical protein
MGDEAPPPAEPADTRDTADVPPWLMGGDEAPPPAEPADTRDTADVPPWLMGDTEEDMAGPGLPTSAETGLPDWLHGADADVEPPPAESTQPADRSQYENGQPFETSDETSGFIGGADLPSWLRPAEPQQPEEDTSASQAVSWLSSLGTQDEESEVVTQPAATDTLLSRPTYSRTPSQFQAIQLLERLVEQPFPDTVPAEETAQPSLWQRIGMERVLYVLLALALLLGALFAAFLDDVGLGSGTPNQQYVSALVEQVNQLSNDDVVLLAYEWDAQRISELAPLEDAITQHLINQQVGIITLSTDLQGTVLSFDLREPLRQAGYRGQGADYVLLGYQPGGEIALRRMAQDFWITLQSDFKGEDATVGALATDITTGEPRLESLEDLSMIVVMADQTQDVQNWMEQVHRVVPNVPIVLLLPAEISPVVQPYFGSNVYHLTGKRDALTYTELRGDSSLASDQATRADAQLGFAILVFIVLLLIGSVVGWISRRQTRQ